MYQPSEGAICIFWHAGKCNHIYARGIFFNKLCIFEQDKRAAKCRFIIEEERPMPPCKPPKSHD
jgi:hypothetical protein